jgi:hypothetical protein
VSETPAETPATTPEEQAGETPAETPAMTPEEQAANDAHTAANEADQTWGEKIEGRLAAVEAKLGLGESAPAEDTADTAGKEETK